MDIIEYIISLSNSVFSLCNSVTQLLHKEPQRKH
jgi:hypothetical protein